MTGLHVLGDWGTTRLRLFLFAQDALVDRLDGPGIGALPDTPDAVLAGLLARWQSRGDVRDIILCGMAGARGGLIEAAYAPCPANVGDWLQHKSRTSVDGRDITVLPGLRHRDLQGVPDVMRGEETQIFGALMLDPALAHGEQTIVLPGTHSKWAQVKDGAVSAFRTVPTGELYALLAHHSTLAGAGLDDDGDNAQGFAHGLTRCAEPLTDSLFEARAGQLLDGRSRAWARGYLSGLLIGGEITAQAKPGSTVILIGDPVLCRRYVQALAAQDCSARTMDGDATVLAGLNLAKGHMR